jgi:predicted MFS family arabinose efflux permease
VELALLLSVSGGGSMLVALWLPRLLQQRPDRGFMMAGGGLSAVALCLLGVTGETIGLHWWLLVPVWFFFGAAGSLIQTPAGRLLLRSSDEHDRPALYAAQFALSHLCWLVAYPMAGWLGMSWGLGITSAVLGLLSLLAACSALFLWPKKEAFELEHSHTPMVHQHQHENDEHHQHVHEGWEGEAPHSHPHEHQALRHKHPFVIDQHHSHWPSQQA